MLDVSAGGGYTTELLARAVAPTRPRLRARRRAPAVARTPAPSGCDEAGRRRTSSRVVQPLENPRSRAELARRPALDLATLMFNYHDLGHLGVDRARMNAAVFARAEARRRLRRRRPRRPAGHRHLGVGTLHRVEEALVRREVEAAGFRLAAAGDFLRNPADPRDREEPDPPQPKDEFVLKFVKP